MKARFSLEAALDLLAVHGIDATGCGMDTRRHEELLGLISEAVDKRGIKLINIDTNFAIDANGFNRQACFSLTTKSRVLPSGSTSTTSIQKVVCELKYNVDIIRDMKPESWKAWCGLCVKGLLEALQPNSFAAQNVRIPIANGLIDVLSVETEPDSGGARAYTTALEFADKANENGRLFPRKVLEKAMRDKKTDDQVVSLGLAMGIAEQSETVAVNNMKLPVSSFDLAKGKPVSPPENAVVFRDDRDSTPRLQLDMTPEMLLQLVRTGTVSKSAAAAALGLSLEKLEEKLSVSNPAPFEPGTRKLKIDDQKGS